MGFTRKANKLRRPVGTVLAVGFLIGVALLLLIRFNPMQSAFLESFEIENASNEDLEIVPVGMVAASGKYGPLPRYRDSYPPNVPLDMRAPISIRSGEVVVITYDYDDINFRHILVRDTRGTMYVVDTDTRGNMSSCYGPEKRRYSIPSLKDLDRTPDELVPCFDGKFVSYSAAVEYPD